MKALLLLSMLNFSSLAFSATKEQVVEALLISLDSHDLYCKDSNGATDYASVLNLAGLVDFKMSISTDKQPALIFSDTKETQEIIAMFTTNSNLTIVQKIVFNTYAITQVRKNVGTLINPVFQVVEEKHLTNETICE